MRLCHVCVRKAHFLCLVSFPAHLTLVCWSHSETGCDSHLNRFQKHVWTENWLMQQAFFIPSALRASLSGYFHFFNVRQVLTWMKKEQKNPTLLSFSQLQFETFRLMLERLVREFKCKLETYFSEFNTAAQWLVLLYALWPRLKPDGDLLYSHWCVFSTLKCC